MTKEVREGGDSGVLTPRDAVSRDLPLMKFAEPLTAWWSWFAWYPVQTWDYRWRWLCMVERRLMQLKPHLNDRGHEPWFQHRVKP